MTKELLNDWYEVLKDELDKQYFLNLMATLNKEYTDYKVYPKPLEIFKALQLTPPQEVRVVMLSQDPYPHDAAHGLAFSSQKTETPASLRIILREIDRSLWKTGNREGYKAKVTSNDLTCWAKQGVLLLNRHLTVRANNPNSHSEIGWKEFTGKIVTHLWVDMRPKVFVCWGTEAQHMMADSTTRDERNHLVLMAGHPATAAHGNDLFSGNNHFLKINKFLFETGQGTINWEVH